MQDDFGVGQSGAERARLATKLLYPALALTRRCGAHLAHEVGARRRRRAQRLLELGDLNYRRGNSPKVALVERGRDRGPGRAWIRSVGTCAA